MNRAHALADSAAGARCSIRVVGLAAVLLIAARGGAQIFEEEAAVVLVEVPVQVLQANRPVAGLGVENFELYDDGERQEIFSFDVLDFSSEEAPRPTGTGGGASLGPRRNFLFLVDFAYPDSWDAQYGAGPITAAVHGMLETWEDLAELLQARFHPSDRLALAYFSPLRGVKMLQGWTTDRDAVAQALEVLRLMIEAKPEQVRQLWGDWEIESRSPGRGGAGVPWVTLEDLLAEARTAGARADPFLPHRDVAGSLFEGLIQVGQTLDDSAGPRHVVYLSTGFPGASLRDLRTLVREFRRTHWAIQSINTGGLGFGSDSLHMLADETGGQLFSNSNDVGVLLGDMTEQTSLTYALTFEAATGAEESAYHKLRVKLVGAPKGARVIHRRGYYSPGTGDPRQ